MKERQRVKSQGAGVSQPGEGPILEPVVDASQVAQRASAGADAVGVEPAGIEVAVRTTTSRTGDVAVMPLPPPGRSMKGSGPMTSVSGPGVPSLQGTVAVPALPAANVTF